MYKNRIKEEIPEVHYARSKLDVVLQTLVEQKDDGSASHEKDGYSKPELDDINDYSPPASQSKRSPGRAAGGVSLKRKRKLGKEEVTNVEYGSYHHTYVMKLFDRSVDMAAFTEDTPLYPICRAWIRNEPYHNILNPQASSLTSEELENDNEDKDVASGYVYELPKPLIVRQEVDGDYVDLRIPSPLPSTDEPLDIHADESTWPSPEELIQKNQQRWKQVRQKWRNAAHLNELQYADSLNIIKELYDRQNAS